MWRAWCGFCQGVVVVVYLVWLALSSANAHRQSYHRSSSFQRTKGNEPNVLVWRRTCVPCLKEIKTNRNSPKMTFANFMTFQNACGTACVMLRCNKLESINFQWNAKSCYLKARSQTQQVNLSISSSSSSSSWSGEKIELKIVESMEWM